MSANSRVLLIGLAFIVGMIVCFSPSLLAGDLIQPPCHCGPDEIPIVFIVLWCVSVPVSGAFFAYAAHWLLARYTKPSSD